MKKNKIYKYKITYEDPKYNTKWKMIINTEDVTSAILELELKLGREVEVINFENLGLEYTKYSKK